MCQACRSIWIKPSLGWAWAGEFGRFSQCVLF
jgi:hypothetical protein